MQASCTRNNGRATWAGKGRPASSGTPARLWFISRMPLSWHQHCIHSCLLSCSPLLSTSLSSLSVCHHQDKRTTLQKAVQILGSTSSDGNITRVSRNLAYAQRKKRAISGHFLLIFLCLGQKSAGKKPALNPGTRVSLVIVLPHILRWRQIVATKRFPKGVRAPSSQSFQDVHCMRWLFRRMYATLPKKTLCFCREIGSSGHSFLACQGPSNKFQFMKVLVVRYSQGFTALRMECTQLQAAALTKVSFPKR